MNTTMDSRKIPDRRDQVQPVLHDIRVRPDRRLNSISVRWIPVDEVVLYPELRRAFGHHK